MFFGGLDLIWLIYMSHQNAHLTHVLQSPKEILLFTIPEYESREKKVSAIQGSICYAIKNLV